MDSFRIHHNPQKLPRHELLAVEVVGFRQARTGFYQSNGGLPNFRIMLFHTETDVLTSDGMRPVHPNTMFLFDSREPSRYGRSDGREWMHSWLRVSGQEFPDMLAALRLPFLRPIPFDSPQTDSWLPLFHREMSLPNPDPEVIRHLLQAWLRTIARRHRGDALQIPESFIRARRLIEERYHEKMSLDRLAATACLSKAHFCVGFRKYFGTSPMAYVMQYRMHVAAELLEDINQSIAAVAAACGYADVYHFSRVFKQIHGLSPGRYRRC